MNIVTNSRALTLFVMSLVISAGFTIAPLSVEAATSLATEEFITVDGSYKGISVGFRIDEVDTVVATGVTVTVTRATGAPVVKTSGQAVIDLINGSTGNLQLTAPIVIQEGSFTEAGDTDGTNLYWNPAPASWNETSVPTSVTIEVTTTSHGTLSATNSTFNQGAPSWPTYESLLPPVHSSETIEITGNTSAGENQLGWMFNRDVKTQTPFEFNKDEASIGDGSLFVLPITNTYDGASGDCNSNAADPIGNCAKFIGELFLLDEIADIDSISYDFFIASTSEASESQFYLNLYANLPGTPVNNFYQCRFDYVPSNGALGGWATFNIDENTVATHVQSRGGATCPSAASGLAGLPEGSTVRAVAISVGDTTASDQNVSGYLDNVEVVTKDGIDTHTTTYDFEPINNAPVANDQTVLVKKNTQWVIVLGGSDVDGDSISLEDFTQPTHGELELIASDLVYTPDNNYLGEDEFTFTITDGELVSNEGTVSIVVYVDTPSCAEENMVFIGGGLDKCMNLDSIFARVFAVSPAVFPDLEIFVDAFEGFNLPQFLSFLDTIIPDFSSDIDGVFLDPVCVVGSVFNANFDVCVDDGENEEETPTDVCANIDGDQSEVPTGKILQDGQCVDQTTGGGGSTPAPTSGGGGSRGGGGGGGGPAVPQVLGAATGGTCYQFTRNLSFGMRGDEVLQLQKALTAKGHMTVAANGNFGPATQAAVISFQKANNLEQVGMAGPKTRALLNVCAGANPNQALIDELTKKLNTLLEEIKKLLAARAQ